MLTVTLCSLRRHEACRTRYNILVQALGSDWSDDTPVPLLKCLETNGLEDTLWALQAVPKAQREERDRIARLFACDCVERAFPACSTRYPNDQRLQPALEVARRYAWGRATSQELEYARETVGDIPPYIRIIADATCGDDVAAYAADVAAYTADVVAARTSGIGGAADAEAEAIALPKAATTYAAEVRQQTGRLRYYLSGEYKTPKEEKMKLKLVASSRSRATEVYQEENGGMCLLVEYLRSGACEITRISGIPSYLTVRYQDGQEWDVDPQDIPEQVGGTTRFPAYK